MFNQSQLSRLSPPETLKPAARRAVWVRAEHAPAPGATTGPTVHVAGVALPRCETGAHPQAVPSAEQARMLITPSMREPMRYLCKAWADRVPVKLEGATGVGKTAAIRYLAHATNSEYMRVNLSYFTEVEDLLGRYVGGTSEHTRASLAKRSDEALDGVARGLGLRLDGGRDAVTARILAEQGKIRWVDGPVVKALKTGAVLLLDEINLARPEVIEALNGLFDRGQLVSGRDVQQVVAHPHFRVFATQNPASYAGRQDMSQALSSRWATLTWEPLPAAELSSMLQDRYAGRLPMALFGPLCEAHTELAALAEAGSLGQDRGGVAYTLRDLFKVAERYRRYRPLHTRAAMADAALVAREAFEVYLGGLEDPEDLRKARGVLAKALPRIDDDFYAGLTLERTATGYRLGDVTLDARSPGAKFVPSTDLVLTPTLLPIYARLLKALDMGENVALVGERASGKSAMAEAYAAHSQRPLYPEHFDAGMDGSRLIGTDTPQGWQDGLLLHAARGGGVLLADEFNLAPPEILERLNSLLDDERVLVLAEKEGERVGLHPDFCFVATMNPPKYAGRHKLSRAMLNRLTCIAVPTLEAAQDLRPIVEHKLARGHAHAAPEVNAAIAKAVVELHTSVSEAYRTGGLGSTLRRKEVPDYSLRQVLHVVRLVSRFSHDEGVAEALRDALLMGYAQQGAPKDKQAVRERIEAAVQEVQRLLGPAPTPTAVAAAPVPASGKRVIFLQDGVYYGETLGGLAHGQGTEHVNDGTSYEGAFEHGLRHGQGTLRSDAQTYTGGFAQGKFAGRGTLACANGDRYEGGFVDGKRAGQGSQRFVDGGQYTGGFADDTFHGEGTFVYPNGGRLVGEFAQGQLLKGTLRAADGTQRDYVAGPSMRRVRVPLQEGVAKLQGDLFELGLMEWVNSSPSGLADCYERAAAEISQARRDKAASLSLHASGIRSLPPEIGALAAHLTSLDVSGNTLTNLPPEVGQLNRLKELHLRDCSLTLLPPQIGQLKALELLSVSCNALRSLPPELGQCGLLRHLVVHANQLCALPPELGRLTRLTHLSASHNKIVQLPDTARAWRSLEELDLGDNLLRQVTTDLSSWTRLKHLTLACNPHLTEVDANLRVGGRLDLSHCKALVRLGRVRVGAGLDLSECKALAALPADLHVGENLMLQRCTALAALPPNLWVGWHLYAPGCTGLRRLGANIYVGRALNLQNCTALAALTEPLHVGENLRLHDCTALTEVGPQVRVDGCLELRRCTALVKLPAGYSVGGDLDLSGCTALLAVPDNLKVGGGLDLGGCTALVHVGDGLSVGWNVNLTDCVALKQLSAASWHRKPRPDNMVHRIFVKGAGVAPLQVAGVGDGFEVR